jgi:hypothetical protein
MVAPALNAATVKGAHAAAVATQSTEAGTAAKFAFGPFMHGIGPPAIVRLHGSARGRKRYS